MFSLSTLSIAFLILGVSAHTQLFSINTPSKQNVNCIRNTNTNARNAPITDVTSPDMTCGKGPTTPAPEKCKVEAGQSLSLIWGHNTPQDQVMEATHVGPCNVYLVPQSASGGGNVPTTGWFKISEGIWDPVNKWCTDKLIKNKGVLDVVVPAALKAGDYIMRSEINALHNGNAPGGAQFYIFCSEIKVTGSGTALPSAAETVSIPGYLTAQTNGVLFDVYGGDPHEMGAKYPHLGGPVASFAASSAASASGNSSSTTSYSAPSGSSYSAPSGSSYSAPSGSSYSAPSGSSYSAPSRSSSYSAPAGSSSSGSTGYGSGSSTSASYNNSRKKCHRRVYRK